MSEKTKLNSNLNFLFQSQQPPQEISYLNRTFHSSKGIYLSSIQNNAFCFSPCNKQPDLESFIPDSYLNLNEFSIIEELGHGAFGIVYKAFSDKWDEYMALKIIPFQKHLDETVVNGLKWQVLCEKFLLEQVSLLKNRHFIKFYSIFRDLSDCSCEKWVLAMENGAGNMNDILFYRKSYSQKEIAFIISYLSQALYLSQSSYIANRDIKPDNLIIVKDDTMQELYYKIADFGIGCQLSPDEMKIPLFACPGFTELYAAPELLNTHCLSEQNHGFYCPFKADVYSLGVTILKMMGLSSDQIRIIKGSKDFIGSFEPHIRKGYEKVLNIVKLMMCFEPEDRPNFLEVNRLFGSMPKMKPYDVSNFRKLEEKIDNLSNEQKASKCEEMFCLYNKIGDLEKCKHFAEMALKLNSRLKGEINYSTALWSFYLGCLFQEEENYESAVKFYKKSYALIFNAGEAFSLLTANIFNNISLIFREQMKYDLALKLLEKALIIREDILGKNCVEYADSLNNLGSIYQLFSLKKAQDCYRRAYLASMSCRVDESQISLVFLSNLAEANRKIGNLDESIKLNKKCLKAKEKILSKTDLSLAFTYNNLGLSYFMKNKLQKAFVFVERSIEIKKRHLKEEHISLAIGFNNIAIILEGLQRLEESIIFHQKAFKIRKKHFGKTNPITNESFNNFVRIMEKRHNLTKDYIKSSP